MSPTRASVNRGEPRTRVRHHKGMAASRSVVGGARPEGRTTDHAEREVSRKGADPLAIPRELDALRHGRPALLGKREEDRSDGLFVAAAARTGDPADGDPEIGA